MDSTPMKSWMEAYFQAVKSKDAQTLAAFFSEDATYEIVDPFEEWVDYGSYVMGRREIHQWFENFFQGAEEWHLLKSEVLSATPDLGIGHLRLNWVNTSSKEQMACDFIILVTLDSNNLCTSIRDWSRVRAKD